MPAGISLCSHVLGQGDMGGELGLLRRDGAVLHQCAQEFFRCGGEELGGELLARHLGDDPVRRDDATVGGAAYAVQAIAHQGKGEAEECRRLDDAHPFPDVELGQFLLEFGLVRGMDQVEAVRDVAQGGLQAVGRFGNLRYREPGGAEEAEHAGTPQFFGHGGGTDPLGHGAAKVGVADAELAAKRGVAQVFREARGGVSGKGGQSLGVPKVGNEGTVFLLQVQGMAYLTKRLLEAHSVRLETVGSGRANACIALK